MDNKKWKEMLNEGKEISGYKPLRKALSENEKVNESAFNRAKWMDDIVDLFGGDYKKALEEVFVSLSDREAKDIRDHIIRNWS